MKTPGLVTIMVPVLNGELFLPLALDSLLAQGYQHFEIVILDNQSTDRTAEICRAYACRDPRVRYVLDTVNRISHDAANHLGTFIDGEFCMIACDDDLWTPNFLSVLVKYLQRYPDVGLAFPNACYVDVEGNRGTQRLLSKRHLYARADSPLANVWRYLGQRRVVSTIFGLYRSEAYLAALPFDTFDETIADVDNLFLIKLMVQTKVHAIDEVLFFYRNKFRTMEAGALKRYPSDKRWYKVWRYDSQHQLRFLGKVFEVLDLAECSRLSKEILRCRAVYACALYMSVFRLKTALGKVMVSLGLREGPPRKQDQHHLIRSQAHKKINFRSLTSSVEQDKNKSA